MNVLLSIKPEYVDEILKGKKKFEFRKSIFKRRDITKVFIYSSSPIKKIVASFEIAGIIEDYPKNIWDQCHEYGGIAKNDFFDYFKNSEIGYAIKISHLHEFSEPINPYLLKKDFRPPQSYYYLPLDYFRDYEPVLMESGKEYRTDMDIKLDTQKNMLNKNILKSEEKYGWKTVRLGDFAIYQKGKKPKNQQSEASDVFKYPYIDIRAFDKGEIKYYTDGENCVICEEDDLLMVWDGSRSGYVGKAIKGALGSTLMRLKFHATENKFAYYFLKSKYLEINTKPKGTGTPHVDPTILWNYQYPLPPLPEQRTIVSKIEQLFSELDNGIANLKKAQEQLKVYRQAVLKKAFEGELTKQWRQQQTDLPDAEELLEQIQKEREESYNRKLDEWKTAVKEWENKGKKGKKPSKPKKVKGGNFLSDNELEKLPIIPKEWKWIKVGEITESMKNGIYKQKSFYSEEGTACLRMYNIENGIIEWFDIKRIILTENEKNEYGLNAGDLLVNRVNSRELVGKTAVIPENMEFSVYESKNIRLRLNSKINSKLVNYWFFLSANHYFNRNAQQTVGMASINQSQLSNFEYPLCPFLEQQAIVSEIETRLSVCDKVEQDIEENLEKAEALRQSILKKAFEGKLLNQQELEEVHNAPDWEPAEVLLEKVQAEKAGAK
ncbi:MULTISPECIES: restriction endonuclease subunit S [Methanohalophilus]|jgi:type I restriction enzyme S subunit|uniref:Type I restriction enzyme S subunit n=2 Tax=Methanohalophilus euhalobius TaxID=51203 RepID=A0A285EKS2_9EURY|nr:MULTISPECIES: restriction endonuclease subunit S [Methanohalophilus]KXS46777.1 MAG: type I restriction enzyme, S subunit [Methanohalophilus sp. T328-1]OBZ36028.1 MAG: hypothetical protein A9957_04590 [Methanohalophilus sp. DAL1]ODV49189.1 MAG: type I restriction enzyme, S subunit [Methanohalophilus sp. 2-GBenrich]PQV43507.1 type I restriction enzyme S subunit [Methanohalophilus euhalobius]RNI07341.1 hypothetical protein EDD83_09045 [Methanohalophilus euhalobius]